MKVIRPIRLYNCVRCPAKTMNPFYTQRIYEFLCGNCAGHKPGDPPQTYPLKFDHDHGRVYRNVAGHWMAVYLPETQRSDVTSG